MRALPFYGKERGVRDDVALALDHLRLRLCPHLCLTSGLGQGRECEREGPGHQDGQQA